MIRKLSMKAIDGKLAICVNDLETTNCPFGAVSPQYGNSSVRESTLVDRECTVNERRPSRKLWRSGLPMELKRSPEGNNS